MSRFVSASERGLEGTFPTRQPGWLGRWTTDVLSVRYQDRQNSVALNRTSASVWLVCDGRTEFRQIRDLLLPRFPGREEQIARDIAIALLDLQSKGLLNISAHPQPPLPLLRVGFRNMWPGFEAEESYLAWMLTQRFGVLLVEPQHEAQEAIDLLIISDYAAQEDIPLQDEPEPALTLAVSVEPQAAEHGPDFEQCDYALTPGPVAEGFADRHDTLPAWVHFVAWERHLASQREAVEEQILGPYDPGTVCDRVYAALFGDLELDDRRDAQPATPAAERERPAPTRTKALPLPFPLTTPTTPSSARLTVGMATYDDYDGVYFTVQALRLRHPEVTAETEILILDNNPDGPCSQALGELEQIIPGCRYLANREIVGTASRDVVFRAATTPYVLCLDSHVLLAAGAVRQLIDYLDAHPNCLDLLQGPLVRDDLTGLATHFEPVWSHGMYGVWRTDKRGAQPDAEPFDIPMQGLGIFACRKDAWPGFNPRFRGFGGEEGYIHEKFRQAGGRTLCLPFLRWLHRFQRPYGTRYPNLWADRVWNYWVGFQELSLEVSDIADHFRDHLGTEAYIEIEREVRQEFATPFFYFDGLYCLTYGSDGAPWPHLQDSFERLFMTKRVHWIEAVETPESPELGRALSHRAIIARAHQLGFANVLVIEADAVFHEDTLQFLQSSLAEMRGRAWEVVSLGGQGAAASFPLASACQYLRRANATPIASQAIAYNQRIYRQLLDELPETPDGMRAWLSQSGGLDAYLSRLDHAYLAEPMVVGPSKAEWNIP